MSRPLQVPYLSSIFRAMHPLPRNGLKKGCTITLELEDASTIGS